MAKYFLMVDGVPKHLGDLSDDKAREEAGTEKKNAAQIDSIVELWEQTPDRGAVYVNF